MVSVLVPTCCEPEAIPELAAQLEEVAQRGSMSVELIIVNDDRGDEIARVVAELGRPWVRLVVSPAARGVGSAVLAGLSRARGGRLVVMNGDLSHPPGAIPRMIACLREGDEFVIGSRYVAGGSTAEQPSLGRWLGNGLARALVRPFTRARDPMSGFFALSRDTLSRGRNLNPIGHHIGLELLVKCDCRRLGEVPIHFDSPRRRSAKLALDEHLRLLKHLRRLFIHRFPNGSYLGQFLLVGASGIVVNLAVLTALLAVATPVTIAVALAIGVSLLSNFALNRRFTFSYARHGSILKQLAGYMGSCSLGALVNYGVTLGVIYVTGGAWPPQLAAMVGIPCGTVINYLGSRYVVFRKQHDRAPGRP